MLLTLVINYFWYKQTAGQNTYSKFLLRVKNRFTTHPGFQPSPLKRGLNSTHPEFDSTPLKRGLNTEHPGRWPSPLIRGLIHTREFISTPLKSRYKTDNLATNLIVPTLAALVASWSWIILARGHSMIHVHMNQIVFFFPFLLWAYLVISVELRRRLPALLKWLQGKLE